MDMHEPSARPEVLTSYNALGQSRLPIPCGRENRVVPKGYVVSEPSISKWAGKRDGKDGEAGDLTQPIPCSPERFYPLLGQLDSEDG